MKKFAIIYGALQTDIQKRAMEELTRILLEYTIEYPVCIPYGEDICRDDFRRIYVGTKENNPFIKLHSSAGLSVAESYAICVKNDTVMIEGFDDAGTLYGVSDFYNRYIVKFEHPDTDEYWINILKKDRLPDFEYVSAPKIRERGLWTWGHVIYDYRGYLDNMMKLKMNRVIIWNDFAPANAKDIVEYAHSRNIKLFWGFSWLWGISFDLFDFKDLSENSKAIFQKYEKEYAHTGADGIYFQTFTELETDNIDGVLIAEAASNFVNQTAALFYEKYPSLEIQFGLHATSVKDRLEFIKKVDPRIRIVWENCGAFPFAYITTNSEDEYAKTHEFVRKIARLRGDDDRFGVVTKGLVKLEWREFEHLKGPQCIGVSSKFTKSNRIERKKRIWRYVQSGWLTHAPEVHETVKELTRLKNGDLAVFALVEDGMFEENIMYPVALYSEMLWDCEHDLRETIKNVALRSYVTFA